MQAHALVASVHDLLNNAYDAVEGLEDKWIRIDFFGSGRLDCARGGGQRKGIRPALREKILEPFFTTKDLGKERGWD